MGWLDFIAALVGALAWPLAAVIIASLFRQPITGLLNKVRKLNWGDKSVDLSEKLDTAEDQAQSLPEVAIPIVQQPVEDKEHDLRAGWTAWYEQFVQKTVPATAGIITAWQVFEAEIAAAAERVYDVNFNTWTASALAGQLHRDGHLRKQTARLVDELQAIRDDAAYGRAASDYDALRFYRLLKRVAAEVEGVGREGREV